MSQSRSATRLRTRLFRSEADRALSWLGAALFGGVLGMLLILFDGLKFPGHRSFVYMVGIVIGQQVVLQQRTVAIGLTAGLLHFVMRVASTDEAVTLETVKLLISPLLLAAVWGFVAPRLPAQRHLVWMMFSAIAVSLLVPALTVLLPWIAGEGSFLKLLAKSSKALASHPLMGGLGALCAAAARRGAMPRR